jgi:bacillithiol biosynthesis cysteine-adding enzyme BshC
LSKPRVVTKPLGGSALTRAVLDGALGAEVTPPTPVGTDEWTARVRAVQAAAATDWFGCLREAFGGPEASLERLQRTAQSGGVVVTTGQQPGLFGGPIYTWSKAVAALALADALERATGIAVAPVFWAATDDADFDEANHTVVVVNGQVERLTSSPAPTAGTPMTAAALGDVQPLLHRLRVSCGSMAYDDAYRAVEAAYADGTVGDAYVRLLRTLLGPLGVAVLDASHPSVREAAAPVLRAALERAPAVQAALDARHALLADRGFEPQVAEVAGLSTVFVYEDGIKRRVPLNEAAPIATKTPPERLSPNVLLRPVVEASILPTVAYAAGPGELAYFAQVSAVASAVGAAQPLAVPRWSCTIVEPAVDRAMQRLGVDLDLMADGVALETRVAGDAIPDAVRTRLADLRHALKEGVEALRLADAAGGASVLKPEVADGVVRQIGFRIDRLERRMRAAAKRRGSDALHDLHAAQAALWPDGHPQERTLNFIPLLARYGPDLLALMRDGAGAHADQLVTGAARGA